MSPDPVRHADTIIFPASLDPQAVSVVRRLREAGYESYLVGGCVRDLLLGHIPKDFDASTEARPRQIRRVFRNCRIIGRRFKLAHVHFGSHIIEVATFRRNPTEAGDSSDGDSDEGASGSGRDDGDDENLDSDTDDLLITRDNVYGTAEEDTLRRDFTINALLYDVLTDEVIDYVGGVKDVEDKVLRTIGDPMIRIAEDPVRMLRAVKFTARLGLTMDPALDAAMRASAELIDRSAPPRVLEEIYKILTCGAAARALELLLEYDLLARLLPELSDHWKQRPEECVRLGAALDHVDRAQRRVDNSFVLALLFHDVWRDSLKDAERVDPLIAARELIAPAAQRMNIPRRDVSAATQLLLNQSRLERSRRGRRFRMADFLARDTTVTALDLLYVRCLAGLADPECHARWVLRLAEHRGEDAMPRDPGAARSEKTEESRAPRKRRRRGGRRRSGARGPAERTGSSEGPSDGEESERPRRRSRGGRSGGRSRGSRATAAEAESGPKGEEDVGSRSDAPEPREAAPSAKPASTPSASTEEPTPSSSGSPPQEAGIKGRIKGLLRRVIGRDQPAQRAAGASASPPPPPTETTPAAHEERPTTDATSPQKPRGERGRGRRGAEAGATSGSEQQPASRTAGDADGEAAPEARAEGSAGRPRRSRRPRRRKRGGASRSPDPSKEALQDAGSDGASEQDSSQESSGGDSSAKRSSRRRSRGGSRKKSSSGAGRGQAGKPRAPRSKPKAAGSKSDRSGSRKPSEEGSSETPGRHPEDIEDMFDW